MNPTFSVIIPARNEERLLPACLASIRDSGRLYRERIETIVVVNRCTDRTEEIARAGGARVVFWDAKNLSAIRNAGARVAEGEILVTLDADSTMTRNLLPEIDLALRNPRVVGGGVWVWPERLSPAIFLTGALLWMAFFVLGISCGCFWCRREDFWAIGGFDETRWSAEDIDFARRLRQYGRRTGRVFQTLWRAGIRTSCRKFDQFGDSYMLRHPLEMLSLLRGRNRAAADRYWYDVTRS